MPSSDVASHSIEPPAGIETFLFLAVGWIMYGGLSAVLGKSSIKISAK